MRGYDYFCWSVALFIIIYILAISVLPIFLNRPHVGMRIPRMCVFTFFYFVRPPGGRWNGSSFHLIHKSCEQKHAGTSIFDISARRSFA